MSLHGLLQGYFWFFLHLHSLLELRSFMFRLRTLYYNCGSLSDAILACYVPRLCPSHSNVGWRSLFFYNFPELHIPPLLEPIQFPSHWDEILGLANSVPWGSQQLLRWNCLNYLAIFPWREMKESFFKVEILARNTSVIWQQTNSVALVRERNIPTERPPIVGEVNTNFCRWRVLRGQLNGTLRQKSRFYRPEPLLFSFK
jgi:hypothetical protein